jgi:hypothetical protein
VQALKSYQVFIDDAYDKYIKLDNETYGNNNSSWFQSVGNWFNDVGTAIGVGIGNVTRVTGETVASWWDKVSWAVDIIGLRVLKLVGDNWSVIESYIDIGMGVFEVVAGAALIATGAGAFVGGVTIADGLNRIVGNVWDLADGDAGSGKDFSDLVAWGGESLDKAVGGDGHVGKAIGGTVGTITEITAGAIGGYGITKATKVITGAKTATEVAKSYKATKKVVDYTEDVGKIISGDIAGGTTGLVFDLVGSNDVLKGRPTYRVNINSNQDVNNIIKRESSKVLKEVVKAVTKPETAHAPAL